MSVPWYSFYRCAPQPPCLDFYRSCVNYPAQGNHSIIRSARLFRFRVRRSALTWDPPKFSIVNWESSETLLRLDRRPAYELLLCSSQLLGRPAASALVTDFSSATELNVGMPLPRWTTKLSSLPARLWEMMWVRGVGNNSKEWEA